MPVDDDDKAIDKAMLAATRTERLRVGDVFQNIATILPCV